MGFSHPLFTLLLLLGVAYISYPNYSFVYSLFTNYNSLHGLVCLFAYLLKDYVLMVSSLSMIIRPPMHSGPRCYEWNRDPRSEYIGCYQLEKTLTCAIIRVRWCTIPTGKDLTCSFTLVHGIVWFLCTYIKTCVNSPTIHLVDIILYICYRYIYSKLTHEENIRT